MEKLVKKKSMKTIKNVSDIYTGIYNSFESNRSIGDLTGPSNTI